MATNGSVVLSNRIHCRNQFYWAIGDNPCSCIFFNSENFLFWYSFIRPLMFRTHSCDSLAVSQPKMHLTLCFFSPCTNSNEFLMSTSHHQYYNMLLEQVGILHTYMKNQQGQSACNFPEGWTACAQIASLPFGLSEWWDHWGRTHGAFRDFCSWRSCRSLNLPPFGDCGLVPLRSTENVNIFQPIFPGNNQNVIAAYINAFNLPLQFNDSL